MHKKKNLLTDSIPSLMLHLAVPASTGYFFNTMFNVTDTYFAGKLSTQSLAALSLCFPLFFLVIAFGNGLGTGITALVGNALGASKEKRSKLFSHQGISTAFMGSVLLGILGYILAPYLLTILHAKEKYLTEALSYIRLIFIGAPFFLMNYSFNGILNAHGDTKSFRNFLIIGFLLNIVLDKWFIFGGLGLPAMGVSGVALATILIQFMGNVYLGRKVCKSHYICIFDWKSLRPRLRVIKAILSQAVPAALGMLTVALGIFIINYFIGKFGKDAIASYGAAVRIEQIALLAGIGLNTATLSLTSRNFGAGAMHRIKAIQKTVLGFGFILTLGGASLMAIFASPLMNIFTEKANVVSMGVKYLRIDAITFYAYLILFSQIAILQGMKKPHWAIWLGVARQGVLPFVVFTLIGTYTAWGLTGIWWGICAITWTAAIVTLFYSYRVIYLQK